MKFSVLIPAFNAGKTIADSLDSVLKQSYQPTEIVVLVDGATDDTVARLQPYNKYIKLFIQENQGVACARNRLVQLAHGDLLAFLDADDIWHPQYLETQLALFQKYSQIVAGFTGHTRFSGKWQNEWPPILSDCVPSTQLIGQVEFLTRYNVTTAVFGSMSYCCVSKKAMEMLGSEPFSTDLHAVEDSYLCNQLALLGPVGFDPVIRVAYRLTEGSLSENRLRNLGYWVSAFERLVSKYQENGSPTLAKQFNYFHASKRREFAKVLLGVGNIKAARFQLKRSLRNSLNLASLVKSFGLLSLSWLPKVLQPTWPSPNRQSNKPAETRNRQNSH